MGSEWPLCPNRCYSSSHSPKRSKELHVEHHLQDLPSRPQGFQFQTAGHGAVLKKLEIPGRRVSALTIRHSERGGLRKGLLLLLSVSI